jgi:hypothetical protein
LAAGDRSASCVDADHLGGGSRLRSKTSEKGDAGMNHPLMCGGEGFCAARVQGHDGTRVIRSLTGDCQGGAKRDRIDVEQIQGCVGVDHWLAHGSHPAAHSLTHGDREPFELCSVPATCISRCQKFLGFVNDE